MTPFVIHPKAHVSQGTYSRVVSYDKITKNFKKYINLHDHIILARQSNLHHMEVTDLDVSGTNNFPHLFAKYVRRKWSII